MEKSSRRVGLAILILVGVLIGLGLWNLTAGWGQGGGPFSPLIQAYERIRAHFYYQERLDDRELLYGAVRGLVEALHDPYSRFLTPEEYQRFTSIDLEGEFVGIGVQIAIRDGRLVVIAPLSGSPAERAGVRVGDIILEIDGRSTEGITLDEAVALLRGEEGTEVTLKLQHLDGTIEEITIVRELIELDPVDHRLEGERIGYIRITTFNRKTAPEFNTALQELLTSGVEGLILDLRSNPGGLLDGALLVASNFIDEGLIFRSTDRYGARDYPTRGNSIPNLPLAVLIDRGTASAAEILAGAIQDHRMGVLVGERTFGKGVIQTPYVLSDGSAVIITTAEYTTPNGHRVQDLGLVPDIPVTNEEGGEDRQLQAARRWVEEHLGSLCPCPALDDRGPEALLPLSAQG
ncbi:TPA: S41 family peptidase [Candidatus Bipolaricaulota bacterium]|nr:S41 family peptidase [Candidatus Bipolaricaulota bacterium]